MNARARHHFVIFVASLICISLELFLTRILNLKAWNHVVYTVIPFAMLGYGIGANIVLIFNNSLKKFETSRLLAVLLLLIAATSLLSAFLLKDLPIRIDYLLSIFANLQSLGMLLLAYTLFMVPFILIGFLIVYLFTTFPADTHKLYFFDLMGAAAGAYLFFILIDNFAVFHSLIIFFAISLLTAVWIMSPQRRWVSIVSSSLVLMVIFVVMPEPVEYTIDPAKGWEWIPGYFKKTDYDYLVSRWHPLGRTDVFRIKGGKEAEDQVNRQNPATFEINLAPPPEFSYFSSNFLAGTPVYEMSREGLAKRRSEVRLFTKTMELPYLLLKDPKVVVIGTGGGRDIFMAGTHGAKEIVGAEINPGIVREMTPGGTMYDYSGRIYTGPHTQVFNIDGRHLVKKLSADSADLVIMNGVDTFSGLSSGAYAYAESYLYTQSAFEDYLRILRSQGFINIYRWAFPGLPREELRLFAIALSALRDSGASKPWEHIIVGRRGGWSIFLIKKSAFSAQEQKTVRDYLTGLGNTLVYPQDPGKDIYLKAFSVYVKYFKEGKQRIFEQHYPYDISVVTDDNPFFYKYYKFDLFHVFQNWHTGTIVFWTQVLILIQAIVFITLFICLPLIVFKKEGILKLRSRGSFIAFFSCLGVGFMFIEISAMQRFVLLLGSPIYSISVILAALLASTGVGSLFLVPVLERRKNLFGDLSRITLALVIYILLLVVAGTRIYDFCMGAPFVMRALLVGLLLTPAGLLLGTYFPIGLRISGKDSQDTVAWAWGLNCACSVLGSILSIMIAQFSGFNLVMVLACVAYIAAAFSFKRLLQSFDPDQARAV